MAFFGTPNGYVGLDIGTSSLKAVELINRRKAIEVSTYAEANVPNLLLDPPGGDIDAGIKKLAQVVVEMFDAAGVSTDAVVAALPNSIVFSTVITLPTMPEKDIEKAIHFAARDVVPADINEMFLGWSRIGELPHMDDGQTSNARAESEVNAAQKETAGMPSISATLSNKNVPIFITAAPKNIVERYTQLMVEAKLDLVALEVETFPLVRSLLTGETDSAIICDIGDRATTYHLIDHGTPRISHTIDYGGLDITKVIAAATGSTLSQANAHKVEYGLLPTAPEPIKQAIKQAVSKLTAQAERLFDMHRDNTGQAITKTVLIGGGAKLKGLADVWSEALGHRAAIGNPWRGLTYPPQLEPRLKELGPTFGVAVGLAHRQLSLQKK